MKIAFVIQRYGDNITGGSESLCRQISERMIKRADVEIITTCANDYITWENFYSEGEEVINDIRIHRFPIVEPREINSFNQLSNEVLLTPQPYSRQVDWVIKQGPYAPGTIEYIKKNRDRYDAFIFFTYLYYPTYFGLQIVPEKSIFVPTAHDEPPLFLDIYKALFFMPRAIAFNTEKERDLVHRVFKNNYIPCDVTGTGIDEPERVDVKNFRERYGIERPYILNMGRIEAGKGSKKLYDFFCNFKRENKADLDLVFIGQLLIDIDTRDDVKFLGYIPDDEKYAAITGAEAVIVPSPFESLALAQLEAWICKTPTISADACEVTKEHALKSGGGLVFSNYYEFVESIKMITENYKYRKKLGKSGYKYVKTNYTWDKVLKKYWDLISIIK
jgi:glycosyltransferase involved in cell wall biosynthesis